MDTMLASMRVAFGVSSNRELLTALLETASKPIQAPAPAPAPDTRLVHVRIAYPGVSGKFTRPWLAIIGAWSRLGDNPEHQFQNGAWRGSVANGGMLEASLPAGIVIRYGRANYVNGLRISESFFAIVDPEEIDGYLIVDRSGAFAAKQKGAV